MSRRRQHHNTKVGQQPMAFHIPNLAPYWVAGKYVIKLIRRLKVALFLSA